jgi:hypothetical protein
MYIQRYVPPPTLREWLLLRDLEIAASRGYPPGWTVSEYRAHQIAKWTGLAIPTAKRIYHAGLGAIVAAIVGVFGAPFVLAVGLGAAVTAYLEAPAPRLALPRGRYF